MSSSTMSVFQHAGSQSSPSFASLALTSSELPIVAMNTCRSGRLVSLCVTYSRRSMLHGRLFEHWLLAHIQQWKTSENSISTYAQSIWDEVYLRIYGLDNQSLKQNMFDNDYLLFIYIWPLCEANQSWIPRPCPSRPNRFQSFAIPTTGHDPPHQLTPCPERNSEARQTMLSLGVLNFMATNSGPSRESSVEGRHLEHLPTEFSTAACVDRSATPRQQIDKPHVFGSF